MIVSSSRAVVRLVLAVVAGVGVSGHVLAGPMVFTSRAEFMAALDELSFQLDFESVDTTGGAVAIDGDEFVDEGFRFSTPIQGAAGQLYVEPGDFYHESNSLSLGNRPFGGTLDGDEDDLFIDVVGSFGAVAFEIDDNDFQREGEGIRVFGADGLLTETNSIPRSFFGVISDTAITRIAIDEFAFDGDDLVYDNFILGNAIAPLTPIPEPSTLVLLGFGSIGAAAAGWRRRRREGSG